MTIPFIETSAKNATNVEQCFVSMARDIKNRLSSDGNDSAAANKSTAGTVQPKTTAKKPKKQGGMCVLL